MHPLFLLSMLHHVAMRSCVPSQRPLLCMLCVVLHCLHHMLSGTLWSMHTPRSPEVMTPNRSIDLGYRTSSPVSFSNGTDHLQPSRAALHCNIHGYGPLALPQMMPVCSGVFRPALGRYPKWGPRYGVLQDPPHPEMLRAPSVAC